MSIKLRVRQLAAFLSLLVVAVAIAGCAEDEPRRAASGPANENPAAAGAGNVIPSVGGGGGNGGGVSGGGAGIGSAGQGSR